MRAAFLALQNHDLPALRAALEAEGADVRDDTSEPKGMPLAVAAVMARAWDGKQGEEPVLLAALLAAGADPNAGWQWFERSSRYTALHAAVREGDAPAVALLLAHGGDGDLAMAMDPTESGLRAGTTPRMLAERDGNPAVVALLPPKAAPKTLAGKWRLVGEPGTLQLKKDGTFSGTLPWGEPRQGRWRAVEGGVELDDRGTEVVSRAVLGAGELLETLPGGPQPATLCWRRA